MSRRFVRADVDPIDVVLLSYRLALLPRDARVVVSFRLRVLGG